MHELFGVRKLSRYGLVERIEDGVLEMTFMHAFGDIAGGTTLQFAVAGNANARSFMPVYADEGEVIAVDGRGRPALVRNYLGTGQAVLCTYPLEHMAAETAAVNPENTWRLYRALALEAGVRPAVRVDSPDVTCGEMVHRDGRRFVWLINLSGKDLTAYPVAESSVLVPLGGEDPVSAVRLSAFGVEVLERVERPASAHRLDVAS